jgi:putative toxin-antitoxin system antitoxin component (TIGR02293 family)
MKKSAKGSSKNQRHLKTSRFEMAESAESYGIAQDISQKHIESNVVVLEIGSKKKHRVILGGMYESPLQTGYDIYENKRVNISEVPLHYHSKMELVELSQEGVKAKTITRLAELLGISKRKASEFFHFSERTLNDYIKKDKVLDPDSSEKIIKMFSLYLFGCRVFGNGDNFINWMSKPSFGLKNKRPTTLLSSSDGIDLVQEELSRIEYGDFS